MSRSSTARAAFRPGSWYAVLGDGVSVLLPPSERARVAGLWDLVDAGAGVDELLDAVATGGLRTLDGLVVLASDGDRVRVVLRGAPRVVLVTADGPVTVTHEPGTTWAERLVGGVTSAVVEVGGDDQDDDDPDHAAADHLVSAGLVRVARLELPPQSSPDLPMTGDEGLAEEPADEPADEQADEQGVPEPEPTEAWELPPVAQEPAEPEAPPVPSSPPSGLLPGPARDDVPPVPPGWGAPSPVPTTPPPGVPVGSPLAWGPPPPATYPSGAVPGDLDPDQDPDHDGMTQHGGGVAEELRHQQPGIPGRPPSPAVTARPVASLVFAHGDVVEVDRVVLVGRAPEARATAAATEQPRRVTVPSPHQEVSSTHLEVRPGAGADHGSAVVTDLGSTNGTVLVQPGLPPESLQPGVAVQLLPGAVIDLGDGVTIQVARP